MEEKAGVALHPNLPLAEPLPHLGLLVGQVPLHVGQEHLQAPALLDFQHLLHHARTPRGKGHLQQEQVGAFQNEQGQLLGAAHAVEEAHLRPHEEGRELLGPVKKQLALCTLPPPEEVLGALLGGVEVRRGSKELDTLPGQGVAQPQAFLQRAAAIVQAGEHVGMYINHQPDFSFCWP